MCPNMAILHNTNDKCLGTILSAPSIDVRDKDYENTQNMMYFSLNFDPIRLIAALVREIYNKGRCFYSSKDQMRLRSREFV